MLLALLNEFLQWDKGPVAYVGAIVLVALLIIAIACAKGLHASRILINILTAITTGLTTLVLVVGAAVAWTDFMHILYVTVAIAMAMATVVFITRASHLTVKQVVERATKVDEVNESTLADSK